MLSAHAIATTAVNELSLLLADLPIRTEIVPRCGGAIHSFAEARTSGGIRVAVSIERHGPGERIYFDVRREGPITVWFDLSTADLERPPDEFITRYVRPAMEKTAKWLRDQVTTAAPALAASASVGRR